MLEATDGREGLAAAHAEHPDLVITDVLMPVMDGYELLRRLRLDPATSGIPVMFYTAHYGEREARTLALSGGVCHVLIKPVSSQEVLRIVGGVLSGEPAPRLPSPANPLTPEFGRDHLRLLTDKLSEKTGDLRTANARLRALINIGLDLASERDPERLVQNVCLSTRDLFAATYVTLGILDPNDRTVKRFICNGAEAAGCLETGDTLSGILSTVVAERRTFRGDNHRGDPAALPFPSLYPEVHAFLVVPIASPSHVFGWLCLVGNDGTSFTEDDEQLVVALAGQVGRILENTYLYSIATQRTEELEHQMIERERAELAAQASMRATRESERLKTAILDVSLDCVVTMDHRGLVTEFNAAAVRTFGYTREEAIGRLLADLIIPPAYREAHRRGLEQYVVGAASRVVGKRLELSAVRRDGTEFPVELAIIPLPVSGDPVFTGFIRDITDRKRAEEDIRHSAQASALGAAVGLALTAADSLGPALQQCAEALVSHVGAAFARIWTLNEREGVLELQASAGLYTHLNGPHGKVPLGQFKIGRIARDRKPHQTNTVIGDPEVNDQDWARREGMVAFAGHPLIVDDRVVGVMALFASRPLSKAVVRALASVAHHIALGIERHRGAETLRTIEERTRFALEAAGVGIWDLDYTTGVLEWSETLKGQFGLGPGASYGNFEAFVERVHLDDRATVLDTVGKAMKAGTDFSIHHRVVWPDGTVRWLTGAGRIVLGNNGEPVRGVGISIDVTERRTLEEQYQQAQKMEAIGRLAGGVAHDFNNLLTVILGYCEVLLADLDPEDPRQTDIAEIEKAGASAAGLTRQLLAFSRKQLIEPTLLDLNGVVANMEVMARRLVGAEVQIVLRLQPGLDPVKADRGQVEQIVMNLTVNALDAMPTGGTLTIETANVELDEHYGRTHLAVLPGRYVVLTMTDTGIGMTPQVQARLFEPFFTTKEPGKGTGLGLATVHGIVTRSGGSVNVYSETGHGTAFKVYFPRADAAEMVPALPQAVARPHVRSETVLVVEDADAVRELARRLLERQGYTVLLAADAQAALELFDGNASIDVLLTDVVMPGASGPELTRQLVERRPSLRVVYMSGYTEEAIVQRGVLLPGIAFLHKPFTSDSLGQKIREVLDRSTS